MARWERSEVTKTWLEVTVKTPCVGQDLYAALAEARTSYVNLNDKLPDSDDAFEILSTDDQITIRFETDQKTLDAYNDSVHADLQRATELLAALIEDCTRTKNVVCLKHSKSDENGNCYHSLARDFLTNLEENPYG